MSTTSKRRTGRKAEILQVFTRRIAAQGYDATSLSEIAEDLQLSKGTIMHHYGSKDRLLEQMSLGYMRRRLQELSIITSTYHDPVQQLAGIIMTLMTAFRDDSDATRAFSREFMRFAEDDVMTEVRQLRRQYTNGLYDVIARGITEGQLKSDLPHVTALQIIGMCNWSWTWIDPNGPTSVEEIAGVYIENVLGGISTEDRRAFVVPLPEGVISARALVNSNLAGAAG